MKLKTYAESQCSISTIIANDFSRRIPKKKLKTYTGIKVNYWSCCYK